MQWPANFARECFVGINWAVGLMSITRALVVAAAIAALAGLDIDRKVFLHINNSNPALLRDSTERQMAERAGWQVPADGTEFTL